MGTYVVDLGATDRTMAAAVGGKGANLGELSHIEGVVVPAGFCVTTEAFREALPSLGERLDRLAELDPDDLEAVRTASGGIRAVVEATTVPDGVAAAITGALAGLGEDVPYAVRSSATAEDLLGASFAGQHDTYLNVVGPAAVVRDVRRCWASLFTERAVAYRLRKGFDHRAVGMAVVVQRLVDAEASGVLFTADPVSGNRRVVVVEATLGLGEALVSGRARPDAFTVRDGRVVATTVAGERPSMTDEQVLRLADLGRRIETHFGCPQDVEWCVEGDRIHVVQSRPMTALFPVPVSGDGANHVYVSVGHQQMMTDAMKPLGLSVWQLTALRPMYEAGGRLFVDVTEELRSPAKRARLVDGLGRSDPLIRDALRTVLDRGDFVRPAEEEEQTGPPPAGPPATIETDPAVVADLIGRSEASLARLQSEIGTRSGAALLDFIRDDVHELRQLLSNPRSAQVIWAGFEAAWWLNDRLEEWLGEKNAADVLTQSVPGNVTSEMGLALLDVADAIRPHPRVVAFLQGAGDDEFPDGLLGVEGGREAYDAVRAYLDRYGMRCAGEIDITRRRWSERPAALLPLLLADVRNFEPGAGARRFERGRQEAESKARELLERLRALPGGEEKADETRRMIERVRTFAGYREYPKYAMVRRYFVYKQALLEEAGRLVQAGLLGGPEDIFFLTFDELHDAVRSQQVDAGLIGRRREAFASHQALRPPRVLTSDGEAIAGAYRRDDLPPGALAGLAVSAGTVEGRARVVHDIEEADLEPGDILVTTSTDPSWSPLFVAAAGLVTEVGGLTTHGAVIAREYGLPAVVGVEQATRLIRDGQRVLVNGTDGYVVT